MNYRLPLLLCLALAVAFCFGCKEKTPPQAKPALPGVAQKSPAELFAYVQQKMTMAEPTRQPSEEYREKNRRAYHGCLDKNKDDECRFMQCSPFALYAADEFLLAGDLDKALAYYNAAFELVKQELITTTQKQSQWDREYEELVVADKVTNQDKRHYLFRRATSWHRLYRNHAELARLALRLAGVFARQKNDEDAETARSQAEIYLNASVEAYAQYFGARGQLLPLLDPQDPQHASFYIKTIKDMDELLKIRHL